jgi:hypothetical protein
MTTESPGRREQRLREAIDSRANSIALYPENHPARELYLKDSAAAAQGIIDARAEAAAAHAAKKRREANQTRTTGACFTALGVGGAVFAYGNIGWLFWVALVAAALGVLVMVGAAETEPT